MFFNANGNRFYPQTTAVISAWFMYRYFNQLVPNPKPVFDFATLLQKPNAKGCECTIWLLLLSLGCCCKYISDG